MFDRGPRETQARFQAAQDRFQDASKTAQDASRRPPDASKTTKIASKTPLRPPKTPPRSLQTPPRQQRSLQDNFRTSSRGQVLQAHQPRPGQPSRPVQASPTQPDPEKSKIVTLHSGSYFLIKFPFQIATFCISGCPPLFLHPRQPNPSQPRPAQPGPAGQARPGQPDPPKIPKCHPAFWKLFTYLLVWVWSHGSGTWDSVQAQLV